MDLRDSNKSPCCGTNPCRCGVLTDENFEWGHDALLRTPSPTLSLDEINKQWMIDDTFVLEQELVSDLGEAIIWFKKTYPNEKEWTWNNWDIKVLELYYLRDKNVFTPINEDSSVPLQTPKHAVYIPMNGEASDDLIKWSTQNPQIALEYENAIHQVLLGNKDEVYIGPLTSRGRIIPKGLASYYGLQNETIDKHGPRNEIGTVRIYCEKTVSREKLRSLIQKNRNISDRDIESWPVPYFDSAFFSRVKKSISSSKFSSFGGKSKQYSKYQCSKCGFDGGGGHRCLY
jgi:hypothetical protein